MQHVRIATYELKDGSFQELADISRKGMLSNSGTSPASSGTASPTSATGRSQR